MEKSKGLSFGMTMDGIVIEGIMHTAPKNKNLFNAADTTISEFASLTPYQYGANNPVYYNDPTGAYPGNRNFDLWERDAMKQNRVAAMNLGLTNRMHENRLYSSPFDLNYWSNQYNDEATDAWKLNDADFESKRGETKEEYEERLQQEEFNNELTNALSEGDIELLINLMDKKSQFAKIEYTFSKYGSEDTFDGNVYIDYVNLNLSKIKNNSSKEALTYNQLQARRGAEIVRRKQAKFAEGFMDVISYIPGAGTALGIGFNFYHSSLEMEKSIIKNLKLDTGGRNPEGYDRIKHAIINGGLPAFTFTVYGTVLPLLASGKPYNESYTKKEMAVITIGPAISFILGTALVYSLNGD